MNAQDLVPKKVFLTSGKGMHESRLGAFENALRQAGIEKYNLVRVSSIMPPECKFVSKTEDLKSLSREKLFFVYYQILTLTIRRIQFQQQLRLHIIMILLFMVMWLK